MNLELEKHLPDGYELASENPESITLDSDKIHVIVRYAVKPVKDSHAELKQQYARDVETCATIDGLEPWHLWQVPYKTEWISLSNDPQWRPENKHRRHPHADPIIAYHKCSPEDKKRWQSCLNDGYFDWGMIGDSKPSWSEHWLYRIKPRTISVTLQNGQVLEFPDPVREPLEDGTEYFIYFANEHIIHYEWVNDEKDNIWLNQGRIYLSESDCQAALDAIRVILSQRSK